MKLNPTAVKLVRSRKLTSNKTEKTEANRWTARWFTHRRCQNVSTKTPGGWSCEQKAPLSICGSVCGRAACWCVWANGFGSVFRRATCECVTYRLSIGSRWSSLSKVPWKPLRTERVTFMFCCTQKVKKLRHPINLKSAVCFIKTYN